MRNSLAIVTAVLALALTGCPGKLEPIDCSLCADASTCVAGESYACECADGFTGDGIAAGTGCTDVDECATGADDCVDEHGTCTNTEGGHVCGCVDGYGGDGTTGGTGCTDVDECATGSHDCAIPEACTNTDGGFTCACPPGYEGDGSASGTGCVDIDECALGLDDCVDVFDGGSCTNTPGSFTCACDEDNTGDGVDPTAGGTGCTETTTNPRLTIPRRMINDKTLTVRADILDQDGKVSAEGCRDTLGSVTMTRVSDGASIPITVTFFDQDVAAPADSMRFYHGIGSISFTLDDGAAVPPGVYRVSVAVGPLRASRLVHVEANAGWRVMPAQLTGADLVWGPHENIRISQHQTEVPAGQTLVIKPGTLIMVDTLGSLENGTIINVNGQVDAGGTLARPIHFFSERGPRAMVHTVSGSLSNADAWRGMFFYGAGSSALKHVVLTGAGNGQVVSHPRAPIINMHGTHGLLVEDGAYVDSTGMMFSSPGTGSYTLRRVLVSRVGIGAEFLSSGHTLRIEDSWWTGIGRGPSSPQRYDGDALHVDGAASNQTLRGNIVTDVGDDCIDHSHSNFTIEDTIIHDCNDKAVSLTAGSITVRNSLVFDAGTGIRGTARVFNSTISAPSPIASVETLRESIVWPQSLSTCNGTVGFSIVGNGSDLSCGMGNQSVNPRFTAPAQCNFHPLAGSPALTMGPMGGRIGWLGFPSW